MWPGVCAKGELDDGTCGLETVGDWQGAVGRPGARLQVQAGLDWTRTSLSMLFVSDAREMNESTYGGFVTDSRAMSGPSISRAGGRTVGETKSSRANERRQRQGLARPRQPDRAF